MADLELHCPHVAFYSVVKGLHLCPIYRTRVNVAGECIIFCVIIMCHVTLVTSQTSTDAKNLRTQLFVTDAYDKKIIPVTDQTDPVEVYVNFYLLAINGLDEVSEVLKTTGYLWILWYDGFLTWDPSSYGGLSYYFWPQDDVWKPDVALKNSYTQYKQLGVSTLNVQVFESTCSMNILYFPFDVQTCSLKFVAWSYRSTEVNMLSGSSGLLLDEYEPNSAWDIIDTSWSVQQESGEAAISFIIKMKRKPLFVVLSVILPITLLAVLNIFVFVLPCDSGERAGYSVTVFLALAVFLTIVSSTLPANSDTVAIFSIYLIIQTVQSTVITLIALAMLRLYSFDENTKIPSFLIALLKCSDRLTCKRQSNKVDDAVGKEKHDNDNVDEVVSIGRTSALKGNEKQDGLAVSLHNGKKEPNYTWTHIINMLDVVFFIFFSTVFVLSTAICFGISTMANQ